MMKMMSAAAVRGRQFGDETNLFPSESVASGSISPNEYAVPRVETITSLAAKPPTRAILVRQSNPAKRESGSRARPKRPAKEYCNDSSASARDNFSKLSFSKDASELNSEPS